MLHCLNPDESYCSSGTPCEKFDPVTDSESGPFASIYFWRIAILRLTSAGNTSCWCAHSSICLTRQNRHKRAVNPDLPRLISEQLKFCSPLKNKIKKKNRSLGVRWTSVSLADGSIRLCQKKKEKKAIKKEARGVWDGDGYKYITCICLYIINLGVEQPHWVSIKIKWRG